VPAKPGVLLLYPGASAGRDQPSLVALDRAVSALKGWTVVRAEFAYRTAGRRAPDKAPALMREVRDQLVAIGNRRRVVVGGRSMGGRICSMVAAGADGLGAPRNVIGVATIAYPLHPPGRPDNLRVQHLPDVTVPWLFVGGTNDPFGSPDELTRWTSTIPGPVMHHWVENKGHDLKGADAEVSRVVTEWLQSLP
jgi:predicted alpha/beta-hydrolase family hydrolase